MGGERKTHLTADPVKLAKDERYELVKAGLTTTEANRFLELAIKLEFTDKDMKDIQYLNHYDLPFKQIVLMMFKHFKEK